MSCCGLLPFQPWFSCGASAGGGAIIRAGRKKSGSRFGSFSNSGLSWKNFSRKAEKPWISAPTAETESVLLVTAAFFRKLP